MTRRTPLSAVLVVALVLTSCSAADLGSKERGDPAEITTTTASTMPDTTTTTTTEQEMTTVTTYPEAYRSPLNGLPASDGMLLDRRAIAVKVDNHVRARPQSGIDDADAMLELLVEGGITRFIALFHDDDADYIGPIRSLRPTDSALVRAIDAPLAMSGGQAWIRAIATNRGVRLIGEVAGFFRVRHRAAPHNLYSDTMAIRRIADRRGWPDERPPGLFHIDEWLIPAERATEIVIDWSDAGRVRWVWDDEIRQYTRWYGQSPHEWIHQDGTRGQITTDVLIVLAGRQYTERNPAGTGSNVPATETTGSGDAWIFAVGRAWHGTWQRDSVQEPFRLFELDGSPAPVPTGIPWISIFPDTRQVTYSP